MMSMKQNNSQCICFQACLNLNLRRRARDGFALGYNLIFPLIIIGIMGALSSKKMFGVINGFQYYSIVMIPFSIVIGMVTAAYAGKDDAYANTADRILASPVSIKCIVLSKILSETIIFTLCAAIVMLLSGAIFRYVTLKSGLILLILYSTAAFFTAAVGTWIGLGMKNFLVIKNFISVPICLLAGLGGCFFRIGKLFSGYQYVISLSPFYWINRSCFMYLYDHRIGLILTVSLILVVIGVIVTMIAVRTFKKEEYGNGELPGYEN